MPGGEPEAPEHIGPYRILDVLGTGGRGVVYLAELPEPRGRRVALKVVETELDPRGVLDRFQAQQPGLARVNHPGLVTTFEAGTTGDGRPWFAMEWVRGVPITEYCDRERLPTRRRLELLVEVCGALQHAHGQGFVHGNIKPSRILVSEDGGRAQVRVAGLGVATALDHRLTEEALSTAQALLTATPAYVSPERLDAAPSGAEPRSDVYSLGVLLYELLVGVPVFEPGRLRQASWTELLRVVREEAPCRPSRWLGAEGATRAAEVALKRGTTVGHLVRELRGDLDRVTLKALEKDPVRRYATVDELALDLKRYLDGEPADASPPGAWASLRRVTRSLLRGLPRRS
jgi:serine/threonine protein kinase